MSFILGLLVGLGLSSKDNRPNVGGIWLETVGDHSTNPFAAQDIAFQQSFGRLPYSQEKNMPKVVCPFCENEVEISGDYFPELACDTTLANCPACQNEIELGWYANFEASRPTTKCS